MLRLAVSSMFSARCHALEKLAALEYLLESAIDADELQHGDRPRRFEGHKRRGPGRALHRAVLNRKFRWLEHLGASARKDVKDTKERRALGVARESSLSHITERLGGDHRVFKAHHLVPQTTEGCLRNIYFRSSLGHWPMHLVRNIASTDAKCEHRSPATNPRLKNVVYNSRSVTWAEKLFSPIIQGDMHNPHPFISNPLP